MRITQITTHDADALNRLIQQFKEATKLKQIISVFNTQVQSLEDVLIPFFSRLNIDISEGTQLDKIGAIVSIGREGKSDASYRVFIKGKIATNISEGTPENLINVFKILTQGSFVFLMELFPAEVALMSTGLITPGLELEPTIKTMVENAAGAAIAIGSIGFYDEDVAFSFEGSSEGFGFGNLKEQGANTSVVANKLVDSGATFQTNGVAIGDKVYNDTDETTTLVVSIDSEIQLTLDADIFGGTGKDYYISDSAVGGTFGLIYNI